MDNMNITSAQYNADFITGNKSSINIIVDNKTLSVPLNPANRHYAEIMRQVEAGTLTIAEAE